jgi:sporulation protein YlmC with PRC-barrel domain
MEFTEGVRVFTPDGRHLGNVDHVVVDPGTRAVTHIVVRCGHLLGEDKVIALSQLSEAAEDRIVVTADPGNLPRFEEKHYVRLDEATRRRWRVPHNLPIIYGGWVAAGGLAFLEDVAEQIHRNLPEEELAVEAGAGVYDASGRRCGRVRELITDADTGRITQVVVAVGRFRSRAKAIPATWIHNYGEDRITLAVGRQTLQSVPDHRTPQQ